MCNWFWQSQPHNSQFWGLEPLELWEPSPVFVRGRQHSAKLRAMTQNLQWGRGLSFNTPPNLSQRGEQHNWKNSQHNCSSLFLTKNLQWENELTSPQPPYPVISEGRWPARSKIDTTQLSTIGARLITPISDPQFELRGGEGDGPEITVHRDCHASLINIGNNASANYSFSISWRIPTYIQSSLPTLQTALLYIRCWSVKEKLSAITFSTRGKLFGRRFSQSLAIVVTFKLVIIRTIKSYVIEDAVFVIVTQSSWYSLTF